MSGVEEIDEDYPRCPICGGNSWIMAITLRNERSIVCLNGRNYAKYPKVNPPFASIITAIEDTSYDITINHICNNGVSTYMLDDTMKGLALHVAKKYLESVCH